MAGTAVPQGEIVVDSRGRTNLARVRTQCWDRYLAAEHEDGTIVLTPAIVLTPEQLERVRQGREWLSPGDTVLRLAGPGDAPPDRSSDRSEEP
jgi:hypothetical protein